MKAKSRILSARRLALLAGAAGLSAVVLLGANLAPGTTRSSLPGIAFAQNMQRPVGFADIVEKVKPAVISVRVKVDAGAKMMGFEGNSPFPPNSQMERFFRHFGLPEGAFPDEQQQRAPRNRLVTGQGSGFFITADGYAVTNNHVVDKADTVEITTDEGKTYSAKVIGTDSRTDLALIKVEGHSDFPHVVFADHAPRIGDWVLAVGNPFGLGGTVTAGIVSARGRDIGAGPYDDFIQIDAPVNKGNSGGPTFDVDGNVIGVNTAIFSPSGGSVGIAFAIPASTVNSVVAQLKDRGSVTRGWIGVQIQPVTAEIADSIGLKKAEGALVADPQANGPAVKAARDLARQIGSMAPGATANLSVWRKGAEKSFSIVLGELPNQREAHAMTPDSSAPSGSNLPRLGLTLAPAGQVAGSGSEGVVITKVDPDGIASEHGLQTGDVILDVGGKKVANPADVRTALSEAQKDGKRSILMRVKSGDGSKFVALRLGRG